MTVFHSLTAVNKRKDEKMNFASFCFSICFNLELFTVPEYLFPKTALTGIVRAVRDAWDGAFTVVPWISPEHSCRTAGNKLLPSPWFQPCPLQPGGERAAKGRERAKGMFRSELVKKFFSM